MPKKITNVETILLDYSLKNCYQECANYGDDMASTGVEGLRVACRDSSGFSLNNWKH